MSNAIKLLPLLVLSELFTGSRAGREPICSIISSNLHSYTDVLRLGFLIGAPSVKCCHGLRVVKKAKVILGKALTCHCVRNCIAVHILGNEDTTTLSSSIETAGPADPPNLPFNGDLFVQIQSKCNVRLGFGLDETIPCK